MDRADVFAALVERGATKAVVEFSGGNDEGGADRIVLFDGDEDIGTVEQYFSFVYHRDESGAWASRPLTDSERREDELAETLAAPVYDEYSGFAGDFSVSGVVEWDAEAGTVSMSGEESEYVPFEWEL